VLLHLCLTAEKIPYISVVRHPIAIAFAESIALPPPTASIKSIPLSRQIFIPSLTRLNLGLGCAPGSSINSTPESFKELTTFHITGLFYTSPTIMKQHFSTVFPCLPAYLEFGFPSENYLVAFLNVKFSILILLVVNN
jgi:hypothetical protein